MTSPILTASNSAARKNLQWKVTGRKVCAHCKVDKPISKFYIAKSGSKAGAPYSYCRECDKKKAAEKKPRKTPDRFESDTHRECRRCHKIKPKSSCFYRNAGAGIGGLNIYCKPCQQSFNKISKERSAGAYSKNRLKKIKSDPNLHLRYRAIGLIRASLKGRLKYKKRGSVTSDFWHKVGHSPDELFSHIERQFTKGMTWERIGEWHIDHIIPVSSFEYTSMDCEGFKHCWALYNLRPLWAKENIKKGAKTVFLI